MVEFGPGASPVHITTPFESRRVVLSNLPLQIDEEDVMKLFDTFGDLTSIALDVLPTSVTARAVFLECSQAVQAVNTLDGAPFRLSALAASLDLRATIESGASSLLSRKVKLSCYAPSRRAWAHYKTLAIARHESASMDGKTFDGRKIKTSVQLPSSNSRRLTSFSVEIKGLPVNVNEFHLKQFCRGASSVAIGELSYGPHLPVDKIRLLLASFGPVDSFEMLPVANNKPKITAFAQFSTSDAAAAAAKTLNGVSQDLLGYSPLWVQQVHSVKYSTGARQFLTLKNELDRLRDVHDKDCKIRYYDIGPDGQPADPVFIRIYGEEPQALGRVKMKVEGLLRGEAWVEDGKDVWDEFFDDPSGEEFLHGINVDGSFFVKSDTRLRTVYLFGDEARRDRAKELIRQRLMVRQSQRHVVSFEKSVLRVLLSGGYKTLQEEFGSAKVSLDIVSRTLTIQSEASEALRFRRAVATISSSSTPALYHEGADCPVCFCPVTDPVNLPCGHDYCRTCLQHLLRAATSGNFSQLECIAESQIEVSKKNASCGGAIPYHIIRDLLSPTEEKKLFEASFTSHIHARPNEFRYCPTPDCQVIYRPGEKGTILQCPSCLSRICAACHVEFHEGLTCEEYHENTSGGLDSFNKWRLEHNVKPCPNCRTNIEKIDGCNHMTCRCGAHICWVCMKSFSNADAAEGVYQHMTKAHGGFYS